MEKYNYDEVFNESLEYFGDDELATKVWINKYCLKNSAGELFEKTPDDMHRRLAKELHRIENKYPNPLSEEEIYSSLKGFKRIVPQGSPMSGIGNNNQITSIANCFVIGNEYDSYSSIYLVDQEQGQIMKRRGGVGNDLSNIRPANTPVKNDALTSTGVAPFMERFSNTTNEVAQAGRRGALMLSISIKHPDSVGFIDAKLEEGKISGANISVKLDNEFMDAIVNETDYYQIFPITYDINSKINDIDIPYNELKTIKINGDEIFIKKINPKKIWDKIIYNAWKRAEPGILFWDTLISESIPSKYGKKWVETSTNPCGELPLPPYDSCRLLAINLFGYVVKPFTKDAFFDWDNFKNDVIIGQRYMDDIVDLELEKIDKILTKINNDPEPEFMKSIEKNLWLKIKNMSEEGRRTGLGITAEGDMLAALGFRYGSDKSIGFIDKLHKTIKLEAYRSSNIMAKERGSFPIWDSNNDKISPFLLRIKDEDLDLFNDLIKYGRRNIALLTIAPTGSVSICTQTTSGVEPVFLPVYKRRRKKIIPQENNVEADFIDKQGVEWMEYTVFHHKFKDWLIINGYDIKEIEAMNTDELNKIVEKSPYHLSTSQDINWVNKVKIQGIIQKHVDHSISVTVNLPKDVDKETVSDIYMEAWKSGCKGVTVYRDGSREGVLVTNEDNKVIGEVPKRPKIINADVIRFQNNYEKWVAIIGKIRFSDDDENKKPYEFFTGKLDSFNIPNYIENGEIIKRRTEEGSVYDFKYRDKDGFDVIMEGLSRSFNPEFWNYAKLISGLLRHRMDIKHIIKVIKGLNLDDSNLNTWKNGIIRVLNRYIIQESDGSKCPACGAELVFSEGCLSCKSCGEYAKCE